MQVNTFADLWEWARYRGAPEIGPMAAVSEAVERRPDGGVSGYEGFSYRNIRSIRQWYLFTQKELLIWQQVWPNCATAFAR